MVAKLSNNHTFKLRELNYNKISEAALINQGCFFYDYDK